MKRRRVGNELPNDSSFFFLRDCCELCCAAAGLTRAWSAGFERAGGRERSLEDPLRAPEPQRAAGGRDEARGKLGRSAEPGLKIRSTNITDMSYL